jgi:hypothetical protein
MKLNINHKDVVRARTERLLDIIRLQAWGYLACCFTGSPWRYLFWAGIALEVLVAAGHLYLAHQRLDEDPLK